MILQVHDELVLETDSKYVDAISKLLKTEMENAYRLVVPLVVDVSYGKNWDEAH
ncbi:MAG: DNA polymerase [Syntrophaceae bacterium]|nr:DNA polymerase [Syntrophaceae bacterium]